MIEKEFDSVDALLTYIFNTLKKEAKEEARDDKIKVNYESSQEDLIKRLREQNRKYYIENNILNKTVEGLTEQLKEAGANVDKLSKENASLKGGPYNKDFYISVMNNLGRKIVDEYVLWLNLCKALKLEDTEMWDSINDDMYDKIPE